MTENTQISLPPLSYRALTGTDLQKLGERVQNALESDGYKMLGKLSSANNGTTTMYVQAVISPSLSTFTRVGEEEVLSIPHNGGTDRAFCEGISLLLDSGSWQLEENTGPTIVSIDGQFQLRQEVVPQPYD